MSAAVGLVGVDIAEDVQRLEDPAVGGDRLAERGRVAVALQHRHHVVGPHGAGVDRGDDPEDVLPVPADLRQVDPAPGESGQGAVVGLGPDPPALLVRQVRQRGPVGDAEQLQEAEDQVGVRAGVGDDDLGELAAVQAEDDVDHVQGIPHRPGHDLGAAPHAVVVYRVQPGHAALGPEVLAVRAGERGRDRDDEPHPVNGRNQPAAPRLRERQPGLPGDQRSVRCGQGFGPHVVLEHVRQPRPLQCRDALLGDRPVPDVHARAGARPPGRSPSGVTMLTLTDCYIPGTVAGVRYPSRPCGRKT